MQIAMIQDRIVPASEVDPIHYDRGIFFGDGVYEVMRSYDGKLFAFAEHLQRFSNSLSAIEITGLDIDEIRVRVLKAFDAAGIANAKIYFHVTRGSAFPSVEVTANEWRAAEKLRDRYRLVLVAKAGSRHPKIEFLDDPWGRSQTGELQILPLSWKIQRTARPLEDNGECPGDNVERDSNSLGRLSRPVIVTDVIG